MDLFKNGSHVMSEADILESLNCKTGFPLVDNLLFLESKDKQSGEPRLFPVFIRGAGFDDKDGKLKAVILDILQYKDQEIAVVKVRIPAESLGTKFRIWNLPPDEKTLAKMAAEGSDEG